MISYDKHCVKKPIRKPRYMLFCVSIMTFCLKTDVIVKEIRIKTLRKNLNNLNKLINEEKRMVSKF